MMGNKYAPFPERFWAKVEKSDGCWNWTGASRKGGYGVARVNGVALAVYRIAWTLAHGPIAEGLVLDHLCRNPRCVNPEHLEPVTPEENRRRVVRPSKHEDPLVTHCIHGHIYDEANTYLFRGARVCRVCNRAAAARSKRKRQQESVTS